jgi:peptidyl-prolyl cis-trans isomerase SurA
MIKKNIFLIVIILFVTSKLLADIKIVVSIDDEIITNHDIEKERNYLEVLNPNLIQLDINQKSNLAKNSLINEFVKKKETNKFRGADSNNQLIDDYLKNLYFKLGLSSEKEFENILKQNNNFNLSEIKEKITIELLWNELIYSKYNYQVKIDKNKILSKVNTLQEDLKKEYFLSEIVFAKKKNVTINDLFKEIKLSIKEIGFNNTAQIYSNSESAKFGGKLGWISPISLSKNILEKLKIMEKDEFTDLIKVGNDFLILKIEDIKIQESIIDKEKEIERLVSLETNKQLNKFSKIYFNKSKLNYSINEK